MIKVTKEPTAIQVEGDDIIIGEQGVGLTFDQLFDIMCQEAQKRDEEAAVRRATEKQVAKFLLDGEE